MAFRNFGKWYSQKLETNPMLTKCTTAAAINVFGDAVSQILEISKLSKTKIYLN